MKQTNNVAILLFHPLFHKSRINRVLLESVNDLENVEVRIMYDIYPDFHIDLHREKEILLRNDIIVWQHPFYWYSAPSLLKEWIDISLEHGFAYGREGKALTGKKVMSAITAGGRREVYKEGGLRKYSLLQLLAPFELTARLCNMDYLPPFVVHGTHMMKEKEIPAAGAIYRRVICALRDGLFTNQELVNFEYSNDILSQ
jgi:glutathione-regulated potassium-efflux system ancillary protein KefG